MKKNGGGEKRGGGGVKSASAVYHLGGEGCVRVFVCVWGGGEMGICWVEVGDRLWGKHDRLVLKIDRQTS